MKIERGQDEELDEKCGEKLDQIILHTYQVLCKKAGKKREIKDTTNFDDTLLDIGESKYKVHYSCVTVKNDWGTPNPQRVRDVDLYLLVADSRGGIEANISVKKNSYMAGSNERKGTMYMIIEVLKKEAIGQAESIDSILQAVALELGVKEKDRIIEHTETVKNDKFIEYKHKITRTYALEKLV